MIAAGIGENCPRFGAGLRNAGCGTTEWRQLAKQCRAPGCDKAAEAGNFKRPLRPAGCAQVLRKVLFKLAVGIKLFGIGLYVRPDETGERVDPGPHFFYAEVV